MNNVRIMFLPADVWQGVQAMGVAPEAVGNCTEGFMKSFSDQDIAAIHALQDYQPIVNALGSGGFFSVNTTDKYWDRYTSIVRPLAASSYIQDRVLAGISGPHVEGNPPIKVVDLGPGVIGLVMGNGTLDALRKDNSVLAILTEVLRKALVYGTVDMLMASPCSGFVSRFVAVNAFAGSSRPPSPVFR